MYVSILLYFLAGKFKKALSTRGGEESRHIKINEPQLIKYTGNAIGTLFLDPLFRAPTVYIFFVATGKYNIFTFVPYFLFSQFKRAANVFFLVISILQQVPNVSPTGQWTTLGPLMFILSISALREIAEDYRRQRDDDQERATLLSVKCLGEKWTGEN